MYTAIRALVLCDEVKVARSGKISLVGLANDPLEAGTCPGVAWACPVLLLEADGRPDLRRRCGEAGGDWRDRYRREHPQQDQSGRLYGGVLRPMPSGDWRTYGAAARGGLAFFLVNNRVRKLTVCGGYHVESHHYFRDPFFGWRHVVICEIDVHQY